MPLRKNLNKREPLFSRRPKPKKPPKMKKTAIYLVVLVIIGIGIFAMNKQEQEKPQENPIAKKVQEVIKKPVKKSDPSPTITEIEAHLADEVGEYGYSIQELDTGATFGKRETKNYVAASTVKVAIAAYVYDGIESGRINPERTLTYTSSDYEGGTGSLQAYQFGTRFKVSFLVERMIVVSDNVATNILIRAYGRSNIQAFLNKNGLSEIVMVKNQVTPRVMTKLLGQIHAAKIINESSRDELTGYMKKSILPTRLVAGVPDSVEVAHKIGTQTQAISDIGIVYLAGKPYAIAVYSRGITSVPDAEATIKYISREIYNYENTRQGS